MYVYDEYDQRIIEDRVKQFRDQTRRYLAGELSEEEFRPLRLQNGLYIQRFAPMLRVAVPYGQLNATSPYAGQDRPRLRQGLRPYLHPPERAIQLAGAGRHPGHPRRTGHRADARDPDQRQLPAQHHHRPVRRRGRRRNRRPAPVVRNRPPVDHLPPGIRLPAAQVQDCHQRLAGRPRRHRSARHRHGAGAQCRW